MTNLTDPVFADANLARAEFERILWPNGPRCPHCGEVERVYRINGKTTRDGFVSCNGCHGNFTVTTGTIMHRSHIPLNKWLLAFRLMCASKKGISAHQMGRLLGVSYKSSWFLCHRIREAMTVAGLLGGAGVVGAHRRMAAAIRAANKIGVRLQREMVGHVGRNAPL
jgi:transposase-like protein